MDGFCFFIYCVSLCLFISELSPLVLSHINDWQLQVTVIFVFVVVGSIMCIVCVFPFFEICCCGIICVGIVEPH